jgi:hypothetical protein
MAGFGDQWFIGYSYDFDTTRLANYNSGSHELFWGNLSCLTEQLE